MVKTFVSIDDEVLGAAVGRLLHEAPLESRGEAGASATAQTRLLHLVDDPLGSLLHELLRLVPVTPSLRARQLPGVLTVEVREYAILVCEGTELGLLIETEGIEKM